LAQNGGSGDAADRRQLSQCETPILPHTGHL